MLFTKSYWLEVTCDIDVVPLKHDIRLALRESEAEEGLINVFVPDGLGAIVLAPERLEKERVFLRWLTDWMQYKGEPPTREFLAYLFGATVTIPLEKGAMAISHQSSIFMVDFTSEAKRREWRVAIFSETPPKKQRGR